MAKVWEVLFREAHSVTLFQDGPTNFRVQYGEHTRRGLGVMQAAHELGECILHALTCEGRIDG